jgi:hypothetical protein
MGIWGHRGREERRDNFGWFSGTREIKTQRGETRRLDLRGKGPFHQTPSYIIYIYIYIYIC